MLVCSPLIFEFSHSEFIVCVSVSSCISLVTGIRIDLTDAEWVCVYLA